MKRKNSLIQRKCPAGKWLVLCLLTVCAALCLSGCRSRLVLQEPSFGVESMEGEEVMDPSGYESGNRDSSPRPKAEEEKDSEQKLIWVHVCGAVNRPGVYALARGARAAEAVNAAGGFSDQADPDWINLADVVEDGQQIRVPTAEEVLSGMSAAASDAQAKAGAETADGKINLNTADETELMSLAGIGAARAAAIIEYRRDHGGFSSIEDIKLISGIKDSVFEKIKEDICV